MSGGTIPAPSLATPVQTSVAVSVPESADAVGRLVPSEGPVPDDIGLDRDRLAAFGFTADTASTFVVPSAEGPAVVAVGTGEGGADLRQVGAAFARACGNFESLCLVLDGAFDDADTISRAAEALVEGALLARYSYPALKSGDPPVPVRELTLVVDPAFVDTAREGTETGRVLASATALARDLANTPHNHLSAADFADFAARIGPERGLQVEVFGMEEIEGMGLAGLLCVNAGSVQEARMIKLSYRPADPARSLAMVGKGIMYDSGGISLKPSDAIHAQMKNDMSGAAAILAAMCSLETLGCRTAVTGYLMCTDNVPSGTATALGDVITYRNGTTVEILDSDAEGRVVMADGLILAAEEGHDAVVDIATLTGSALRALGSDMAALFGNDADLIERAKSAAAHSGEEVWQMPLHRPYKKELDSLTADMMNCAPVGKPDAIIAALFLEHFTGGMPWAHLDMAGPAQAGTASGPVVPGCTGWGARLLAHLAVGFSAA